MRPCDGTQAVRGVSPIVRTQSKYFAIERHTFCVRYHRHGGDLPFLQTVASQVGVRRIDVQVLNKCLHTFSRCKVWPLVAWRRYKCH